MGLRDMGEMGSKEMQERELGVPPRQPSNDVNKSAGW